MKTLHDTDLVLWSEQQAAAMREMVDCAADIDWERLALRLDEAGRKALGDVEITLRNVLAQAIAGYCDPGSPSRHLRTERVLAGKAALRNEVGPTMRRRLDLDRLWREGFDLAVDDLDRERQAKKAFGLLVDPDTATLPIPPGLPRACPFTLDELLADDFTYDHAVEQLYVRLTSWRPRLKDQTP